MAISRHNTPVQTQLISQHAPKDLNMIAKVLASRQQRYDIEDARMEAMQDQITKLSGYGPDQELLRGVGNEMEGLATEYTNKDLSDPRIAKEFRTKAKAIANNPVIARTQQTNEAIKQYKEDYQKMNMDGTYRPENDIFRMQLAGYKGAQDGPLQYTGIVKGVDEYEEASKYFDKMPKTGQYQYAQLGDTFKKFGYEGVTNAQVERVLGTAFDPYFDSMAGRQARRRYRMQAAGGQVPTDREGNPISEKAYVGMTLVAAANEQKGTISTNGVIPGGPGGAGGYAGFSSGTSSGGPKYIGNMAKRVKDTGVEFDEETGQFEGDGILSFTKDWKLFGGDKSAWDIISDSRLTEKQKEAYRPIALYAEYHGLTPLEAYKQMDKTVSPTFTEFQQSSKRNLVNQAFHTKGAGKYSFMKVYTQDGREVGTGQNLFEELELLDSDGLYDPEKAKQIGVNVMGEHDPRSGKIAKGVHVGIGPETFIFEDSNPDPGALQVSWAADLKAEGMNQAPDGTYYIYDATREGNKVGVYDTKQKKFIFEQKK